MLIEVTINRVYNQMMDWNKIFPMYKTDQELISRPYKKFLQIRKKMTNHPTEKWAKIKAEDSLKKK